MTIHWLLFFSGLVLLFYPLDKLLPPQVGLRLYEQLTRHKGRELTKAWWWMPMVWLSPLRAWLGVECLRNSVHMMPGMPHAYARVPLLMVMAILLIAVGVQMHTRRHEDKFLAPMGYLSGLLFALLPLPIALLATVLATASMIAFRTWTVFFLFGALGAAAFGYLMLQSNLWVAGATLLMLEPPLISLVLGRTLVLPVRSGSNQLKSVGLVHF
jgi:hypothetical protein